MKTFRLTAIGLVAFCIVSFIAHDGLCQIQNTTSERQIISHGPIIGDLTATSVKIWARCNLPGKHYCIVKNSITNQEVQLQSDVDSERDLCTVWNFKNLRPDTIYQYSISQTRDEASFNPNNHFKTAPSKTGTSQTKIVFGSCADEGQGTATVWRQIGLQQPNAIVLLGDTPYIDTTKLNIQRKRYREFAAVPEMAKLVCKTPLYSTWDDHDFGRNDTNGKLKNKNLSRQAFTEYRPNPSYGNGAHGIYTKFRQGDIEVFLLDTRYFAAMEMSEFAADKPTLLGKEQWKWLKTSLASSDAKFKILACGMIWNGAVRPLKSDHWMNYPHEREHLFKFIGDKKIAGITLVGGDIHRSRVIRHATKDSIGYDVVEFITSPMHHRVIALANQPHPGLIFDAGEPHSFLIASSNPKDDFIQFRLMNAAGTTLHKENIGANSK